MVQDENSPFEFQNSLNLQNLDYRPQKPRYTNYKQKQCFFQTLESHFESRNTDSKIVINDLENPSIPIFSQI